MKDLTKLVRGVICKFTLQAALTLCIIEDHYVVLCTQLPANFKSEITYCNTRIIDEMNSGR